MNSHKHARLTASGRALLCQRALQQGWKVQAAGEAAGASLRTAYKWLARFRTEGPPALPARHQFGAAPAVWAVVSPTLAVAAHCPTHWLRPGHTQPCMKRVGLARLSALQPPIPVVRYERQTPGELLHIDTKRLGRSGA